MKKNIKKEIKKIKPLLKFEKSFDIEYHHFDDSYCNLKNVVIYDIENKKFIKDKINKNANWIILFTEHNGEIILNVNDLNKINIISTKNIWWKNYF